MNAGPSIKAKFLDVADEGKLPKEDFVQLMLEHNQGNLSRVSEGIIGLGKSLVNITRTPCTSCTPCTPCTATPTRCFAPASDAIR